MWTCPNCEEALDDEYDVCWGCGTSADGTEDPMFETADEAEAIYDQAEDSEFSPEKEIEDEFGEPLPDLAECFVAENVTEARFVADQLRMIGIPAVSDRHSHELGFGIGAIPNLWGYGPKVRVRPVDLSRAATWIHQYRTRRAERRKREEAE